MKGITFLGFRLSAAGIEQDAAMMGHSDVANTPVHLI